MVMLFEYSDIHLVSCNLYAAFPPDPPYNPEAPSIPGARPPGYWAGGATDQPARHGPPHGGGRRDVVNIQTIAGKSGVR